MKIYHTEDIVGAILVSVVIAINAIFDYVNSSTLQAVVNAIFAFLATLLLKFLVDKIKKLNQKGK